MDKPVVVFVHGTRTTRHEWDGYETLLPQAQVVAIDLPGHGELQHVSCTRESVLATIDDAVAQASPRQPVVVVGHSLGGYCSALWAQERRRTGQPGPDALVLVGSSGDPKSRLGWIYKGFAKLLPLVGFERMTRWANRMYRLLGEKGELPGPEAYEALSDAWAIVFDECGPDNLREIACPVVLVNGQFDQMRVHVRQFAAAARRPVRHIVLGATHMLPITHAEALAGIIADVIDVATSTRGRSLGQ